MRQSSLKIWQDDYLFEFRNFFDFDIFSLILSLDRSVLILGDRKCGKKHLAYKISQQREAKIVVIDELCSGEFINIYDQALLNHEFYVFIGINGVSRDRDVESRMNALITFQIAELSDIFFVEYLNLRLNRLGVKLDDALLSYILKCLPCSYWWINEFIGFVKGLSVISKQSLKDFFLQI